MVGIWWVLREDEGWGESEKRGTVESRDLVVVQGGEVGGRIENDIVPINDMEILYYFLGWRWPWWWWRGWVEVDSSAHLQGSPNLSIREAFYRRTFSFPF